MTKRGWISLLVAAVSMIAASSLVPGERWSTAPTDALGDGGNDAIRVHLQPTTKDGAPALSTACAAEEPATVAPYDGDEVRIDIPTRGLPNKGAAPEHANITMITCSDFECPYSRVASRTVDQLLARNHDLTFYHVHFPIVRVELGLLKARAASAAQRQGKFWEMAEALYEFRADSEERVIRLAKLLGLDVERFERDLRNPATADEVERQRSLCRQAGVRAVPTFFVNGRRVLGAIPADAFQRIIDRERSAE